MLAARLRAGARSGPDQALLRRAIEEIASDGATLSLELVDVAANIEAMSDAAQVQSSTCSQVRQATAALVAMTDEVTAAADDARQAADAANTAALESRERIGPALAEIQELAAWSAESVGRLDAVRAALSDLRDVAAQIAAISQQSKMLSLNAKVEAYRSGNNAFVVIAKNVQELAERAASSATSVDSGMGELVAAVEAMVDSSRAAADKSAVVQQGADQIRQDLENVTSAISSADDLVASIAKGIAESARSLAEVDQGMEIIDARAEESTTNMAQARDRVTGLRNVGERLLRVRAEAGVECTDTEMIRITRDGASKIQAMFEQAIASGRLTVDDLFDETYVPVPGSSPQQFRTRFDAFTDEMAPSVQEAVLESSDAIDGSCLHDRNGYRPTMNRKYAQPQGDDPAWNAKHARTKGFSKDEAGLNASKNQQPYLLQAYRRTSNGGVQMLRDVSVPIFVAGRHWGSLRTVYLDR